MQGRRRSITAAVAGGTAVVLAVASATALGAGSGETFLTGGLSLPPGAIAGGAGGQDANGYLLASPVSASGRYVAFVAAADGLSEAAELDGVNLFRKDRATGAVVLVSRASGPDGAVATADPQHARISADGSRIAWSTVAALDPADTDDDEDVYLRDVVTQQTHLATDGLSGSISDWDLSGDGAWIAFATEEALLPEDGHVGRDVYRRRLSDAATTLVSARDSGVGGVNADAWSPSISGDGSWVAFTSTATDLVGGFVDANLGDSDVYVRDLAARRTRLVSNAAGAPARSGDRGSANPRIAGAPPSGSAAVVVAFDGYATNLATAADSSTERSVFRRSLAPGVTASSLASRATGATGADADADAYLEDLSDDGRLVVFSSDAANLGAGDHAFGVYVRDATANATALGSVDNRQAGDGTISGDGSLVVWSDGRGLTADSDPELSGVFARAYATAPAASGAPEFVSRPAGSAPFLATAFDTRAAAAGARAISGDGGFVVFGAYSRRILGGIGGDEQQIYRRDTRTGDVELVSRANGPNGAPADDTAMGASISADGTRVVFSTYAALDPADGNGNLDVYVRDLDAAATTLVSRADGVAGSVADDGAENARIAAGGGHVTFESSAANLGVPGVQRHVYLRDLAGGRTLAVDRADGAGGAPANGASYDASPSHDGRLVVFETNAHNLDPADPAPVADRDVYVRDMLAHTTELVSRRSGAGGQKAVGGAANAAISADGRVVAFVTSDGALAPEGGAWAGRQQIVARDLVTRQNALVSRAAGGAVADADAEAPSVSGDGGVIAFVSEATNLLAGVGGSSRPGVFARTMATGALSGPPAFGRLDNDNRAYGASLSDDGQCMAFTAVGHNAATGAAGDVETAYVHVVAGACPKPLPVAPGSDPDPVPSASPPTRPAPRATERLKPPLLSAVSLLRSRFRVARAPTAVVARTKRAGKRRAPVGTAVRFTLAARADVTIAVARKGAGRKVGRGCRRPSRRLRGRTSCVRWVAVRPVLMRRGLAARRHSVAFSGRLGRRALAPGRYRATLKAANARGSSGPATLTFTVVRG